MWIHRDAVEADAMEASERAAAAPPPTADPASSLLRRRGTGVTLIR